jgi:hypothetical protein
VNNGKEVVVMGYILPIIPFQEMQERARILKITNHPVQRTTPITPIKPIHLEEDQNKTKLHNKLSINIDTRTAKVDKIISELTGKGQQFNQTI